MSDAVDTEPGSPVGRRRKASGEIAAVLREAGRSIEDRIRDAVSIAVDERTEELERQIAVLVAENARLRSQIEELRGGR